jgi:translocation and assembly module TamB
LTGIYALLQKDTLGVTGAVTAAVAASGTRANPAYTGSFAFSNAAFGSFRAPFMDGIIDYRGRRLNGEVHLWRSGQQILNVTAHLPLDLALVPVAQRQLPDTLSVQARADSVDLGVLAAVTTTVQQVQGVFSADLGIGGTWETPRLRGGLQIANAAASIPALNVRYSNINGGISLSGDTIRVDRITLTSDRGRAELNGHLRLERLTKPILALTITTSEFKALDLRGYLTLTASGQVNLTGPVFGATLSGRGTVTAGVLHFADLVNKRVVNLDEPWVQDLIDTTLIRQQRLGPEFQSLFFDSLRVRDLHLTMGEDVWLRSNEANIQLQGSVVVNKIGRNYALSGTLEAPRGTYRLIVGPVTRGIRGEPGNRALLRNARPGRRAQHRREARRASAAGSRRGTRDRVHGRRAHRRDPARPAAPARGGGGRSRRLLAGGAAVVPGHRQAEFRARRQPGGVHPECRGFVRGG